MMKKNKKTQSSRRAVRLAFAILMAMALTITLMPSMAFAGSIAAAGTSGYTGKTIVLYTGNLRGDVDQYAKLATAKKSGFEGADAVYLVDAGNYLQGTTYADSTSGGAIYNLMDAAGYDVAAMGAYEFSHDSGVITAHGVTKRSNDPQKVLKGNASFDVISSNMTVPATLTYYDFDKTAVKNNGAVTVGFAAQTDRNAEEMLQDNYLQGYVFDEGTTLPQADVIIGLSNDGEDVTGADWTVKATTDGDESVGALVIDNTEKTVAPLEGFTLDGFVEDQTVKNAVDGIKAAAEEVKGTTAITLNGADRTNWCEETNLGDFTADALWWYATKKGSIDGFDPDAQPVVAIQNGGNCDQFMYTGDVTEADIFKSLPYSPLGIGVVYLTGAQLETFLEAGTSPYQKIKDDDNSWVDHFCPSFKQVSGMTYNVDWTEEYDKGLQNGRFYKAASIARVTITSVEGKAFDPEETYAVVADNYLIQKYNDNSYIIKEAVDGGAQYIDNGSGKQVYMIAEDYLEELGGTIPDEYAEPKGRITYLTNAELAFKNLTFDPIAARTYNGKAQKPKVTVKDGETTLTEGTDYKVAYKNNKDAGIATATVTGMGNYSGTKDLKFKINKAANTLKVKAVKATQTVKSNKKTTIKANKAFKVTKNVSKGKVTYKKTKGDKKISIASSGKITVKKGLKKGKTYTVKVKATSAATANYKAASKTVTLKFKVK